MSKVESGLKEHKNIVELFLEYFEMVPATTDTLKYEAYGLRYQVYCLETRFLNPNDFPDGLEKDEYDHSAEHFLIRHRKTGAYAATARLILPNPNCPGWVFPIERLSRLECLELLHKVPRNRLAEASRFCVSRDFKRRRGEAGTTTGLESQSLRDILAASLDERRVLPHITVALIACVVRMSAHHGITHWYGFMETSLIRLFRSLGMCWTVLGPVTDFHGARQPCIIEISEYLDRVKQRNSQLWDMLTDFGRFWRDDVQAVTGNQASEGKSAAA